MKGSAVCTFCMMTLAGGMVMLSHAQADDDIMAILGGAQEGTAQEELAKTPLRGVFSNLTAEQRIFFTLIEKKDYAKALYQWSSSFSSVTDAESVNTKALYAWLLVKNNLSLTGIEKLLQIESPEKISKVLETEWKTALTASDPVWSQVTPRLWKPTWTNWFGNAVEVRVRGRELLATNNLDTIKDLISKAQPNTKEYSWLVWQLSILLSEKETAKAAQTLAHLMKSQNNPVGEELLNISAARILYQNGYLDAAIKYYEKVPKKSEYWLESQEEMAWAYLRKGEPQNTIAITKTLASKYFVQLAGAEALFLRSLGQLKVCDYPAVVSTLNQFRETFKDRAVKLQRVSSGEESAVTRRLSERLQKGSMALSDLSSDWQLMPRQVTRDHLTKELAAYEARVKAEGEIANTLYAQSLTGGTAQVGFQGEIEKLRLGIQQNHSAAKANFDNRIKFLAAEEMTEIKKMLQKMHIVEAEVLSQSSLADRVKKAGTGKESLLAGSTGSRSADRLVFKADEEVWFDELSNYKVDYSGACQASKKR